MKPECIIIPRTFGVARIWRSVIFLAYHLLSRPSDSPWSIR